MHADMDIASMLEVQVNEVREADAKENGGAGANRKSPRAADLTSNTRVAVTPGDGTSSPTPSPISQNERNFYKLMFGNDIATVRHRRLHCTACDDHIGSAPAEAYNMFEHPVLKTLLCAKCREFYGDGTFEQGDDSTDMFCRWCANGGNLYCCSFCSNTFCSRCIKSNLDPVVRRKIEADEKWRCFVCDPTDLYSLRAICWALLQHVQTVTRILQNDCTMTPAEVEEKMNLDEALCCSRKKRRRSSSEDADYSPRHEDEKPRKPRSRRGRPRKHFSPRRSLSNGSVTPTSTPTTPLPILPKPPYSEFLQVDADQLPPVPVLVPFEQTMTEPADQTVTTDGKILRTDGKIVSGAKAKETTSAINAIPTASLLESSRKRPLLPAPNLMLKRQRILLPLRFSIGNSKPEAVIQLDSDSDDPVVVESGKTAAVPIALVTSHTSSSNPPADAAPRPEVNFRDILVAQQNELESVVNALRSRTSRIVSDDEKNRAKSTRAKTKRFHQEVRKALAKLEVVNDRIVREYHSWRRRGNREGGDKESASEDARVPEIPLEMTCSRESASESDEPEVLEATRFDEMFGKVQKVDQAIGSGSVRVEEKAVQVYEPSCDFEQSIGYCFLSRASQEPTSQFRVQPEHAGKYQEQFIFHLQHLEDHGIETEESRSVYAEHSERSPVIAEDDESTKSALSNEDVSEDSCPAETGQSAKAGQAEVAESNPEETTDKAIASTSKAVEELVRMVDKLSDDLNADKLASSRKADCDSADAEDAADDEATSGSQERRQVQD